MATCICTASYITLESRQFSAHSGSAGRETKLGNCLLFRFGTCTCHFWMSILCSPWAASSSGRSWDNHMTGGILVYLQLSVLLFEALCSTAEASFRRGQSSM